jgi:proteic killer suppression protein
MGLCRLNESFGDEVTEDLFHGRRTRRIRALPADVLKVALRKLDMLNAAHRLEDLEVPPAHRLEALKGNWAGYHSIRIIDQFRVVFRWKDGLASNVKVVVYH